MPANRYCLWRWRRSIFVRCRHGPSCRKIPHARHATPVLVASIEQAESLAETVPASARALMEEFWPGALTIILPARETLGWDLGETFGTVALRMPDDSATRDFLAHIGPLAVTSANKTGQPPATTIADAETQLGESVAVYVDGEHRRAASPQVSCAGTRPQTRTTWCAWEP